MYGKIYYSHISDNIKSDGYYQLENFTKSKLNKAPLISNPIYIYNYYAKHICWIINFLYLYLIFYNAIESANPRFFNYFKIIRYIFEIIVIVFEILRFYLFLETKYFIFNKENKDFVESIGHYPLYYWKIANFESYTFSYTLTKELVKIIFEILHFFQIFPHKCQGNENWDEKYYLEKYHFFNKIGDKNIEYSICFCLYIYFILILFYLTF